MITYNIQHFPVVDDEEGVVGMLSTTDLTAYLSDVEQSSPVSVDHIGLVEVSAWEGCATKPSRQRDRRGTPA